MSDFELCEGFRCLGREDVVTEVGEGGEGLTFEVGAGRGECESFWDLGGRLFPERFLENWGQRALDPSKREGLTSTKVVTLRGTQIPIARPRGLRTLSQFNSSRISTPSTVDAINPRTKNAVLSPSSVTHPSIPDE